jgi:hypothetical protein
MKSRAIEVAKGVLQAKNEPRQVKNLKKRARRPQYNRQTGLFHRFFPRYGKVVQTTQRRLISQWRSGHEL